MDNARESKVLVNKIYCNNCKYLITYEWGEEGNCDCPKNITLYDMYDRQHYKYDRMASDINKFNDCKWYEPKWWVKLLNFIKR